MPYKLSATIEAHSSDVRAVLSPQDNLILSASRDTTAAQWTRPSSSSPFTKSVVYQPGPRYVNAIAYIPDSERSKAYLVTGGLDGLINVYPLDTDRSEPEYTLVGHSHNVCALDALPSGLIVSASWDKTAKVWLNFQLAFELTGHTESVLAVLAFPDGTFVTGSADKTIKIWNQHKLVGTFTGHKDAVRGLTAIPDVGFASCSNDSEIIVWSLDGDVIYSLSGHTDYVYSITYLPNGDLVSSGEDRSVRIWRGLECVQTLVHPTLSVWTVSTMPNGDIVSGGGDGVIRIFSASEERWASSEDLATYDQQVASQTLNTNQVGDVKKTDLPGPDALLTPGRKPGEVKMIREDDKVVAYQWDNISSSWQKVGEVVDAVGSGRKKTYNGKEYDYVFDVDIQDGIPPLKLPYNANENPFAAAQRFLNDNDLPTTYIDQVVAFIEKNTAGVNLSANNELVDPFTGQSRYRASGSSSSGPSQGLVDPFTGSSRYAPTSSTPAVVTTQTTVLPVRTFLHFKQANVTAMQSKVYQFNDAFLNEISTASFALYPDEIKSIHETFSYLTQAVSNKPITAAPVKFSHIELIVQILERWPVSPRFPIIDLARLVSGHCPSAYSGPGQGLFFFKGLINGAEWLEPWDTPDPKSRDTNILLTLRALANALQESTPAGGPDWALDIFQDLYNAPYKVLNKTHRVTLATILFNFSCIRLKGPVGSPLSNLHLQMISRIMKEEDEEQETAYRAAVALGNSIYALRNEGSGISREAQEARSTLLQLPSKFPAEERFKPIISDIDVLLQ